MWFGNNRGTTVSYKHVNLTVDDAAYWNYTFTEMGKYDLPTNINTVLEKTGVSKVDYLGHSQGTTQFWIANCLHDDIGSKIDKMIAFAPVMYLANQNSELINIILDLDIDRIVLNAFESLLWLKNGYDNFDTFMYTWAPTLMSFVPRTVNVFLYGIVGFDKSNHMSYERIPMIGRNDVGGTGTLNLKEWAHLIRSKTFSMLDGTPYDTSKLAVNLPDTKFLLLVGANDAFSQDKDV